MTRRTIFLPMTLLTVGALCADTVSYKYDDAGRLISVSYPNGSVITYTYDPAGNLTSRTVAAPTASDKAQVKKPPSKRKPKADEASQKIDKH